MNEANATGQILAWSSLSGWSYGWHDLAGNLGVAAVLWCYLRVQTGHMSAASLRYSLWNGIGALLIMLSLLVDFNLSSMVIEVAWLGISLFGVYRYFGSAKGGKVNEY